jgi:hypothetical protein
MMRVRVLTRTARVMRCRRLRRFRRMQEPGLQRQWLFVCRDLSSWD